jgi:hypothetical protein
LSVADRGEREEDCSELESHGESSSRQRGLLPRYAAPRAR